MVQYRLLIGGGMRILKALHPQQMRPSPLKRPLASIANAAPNTTSKAAAVIIREYELWKSNGKLGSLTIYLQQLNRQRRRVQSQ